MNIARSVPLYLLSFFFLCIGLQKAMIPSLLTTFTHERPDIKAEHIDLIVISNPKKSARV